MVGTGLLSGAIYGWAFSAYLVWVWVGEGAVRTCILSMYMRRSFFGAASSGYMGEDNAMERRPIEAIQTHGLLNVEQQRAINAVFLLDQAGGEARVSRVVG